MEYKYNLRDLKFVLKEWLSMDQVFQCDRFKDDYGLDDIDPILTEGYRVAREVVNPINVEGDKNPVRFEDGKVINSPGYKEVYQFLQKNGWGSSSECVEVEGGMPLTLFKAVFEMVAAACPAMGSNLKLATGAANLIIKFGTEDDKKRFLPKIFSGEWHTTMNLTEPSAGSDVGDALARSYPTDDPRIWKIKGTKMFITAGDGTLCENVIHMVLARPPQGASGSSGLGLYIIPKYWVNEDGSLGRFNDVVPIGIEHKMGLLGSATCMMNYGENDECYGIMLGDPPDEKGKSKGLAMMFNMMNEARIGTGHNANSQSSAAYALAAQYAQDRIQGYINGRRVPIIKHDDVRRMLLDMKAITEGIRAMVFKGFWNLDMAENSNDKQLAQKCADTAAILTPIIKCHGGESAVMMTSEAIQVLGGVGYTKEYPVEQYLRDSKVLTIWEGTSYIHATDLVGRKMNMENGAPFRSWMEDILTFINTNKNTAELEKEINYLERTFTAATQVMNLYYSWRTEKKQPLINLYAIRALTVFAHVYIARCLLDQALVALEKLSKLPSDHFDSNFYKGKVASARYYANNVLPNVFTLAEVIQAADTTVLEVPEEALIIE